MSIHFHPFHTNFIHIFPIDLNRLRFFCMYFSFPFLVNRKRVNKTTHCKIEEKTKQKIKINSIGNFVGTVQRYTQGTLLIPKNVVKNKHQILSTHGFGSIK